LPFNHRERAALPVDRRRAQQSRSPANAPVPLRGAGIKGEIMSEISFADPSSMTPARAVTTKLALNDAVTATERVLVDLVAEALGKEDVGIDDRLVDIDETSPLANLLVDRIRAVLHVDLTVTDLAAIAELKEVASYLDMLKVVDALRPGSATEEVPPIPLLERGVPLPASFAQERLWFIDQLETQGSGRRSKVYLMPEVFCLKGELDVECLRRALQALVDRHEPLRTSLINVNGRPMQSIRPSHALPFPLVDFSALPDGEREDALRSYVAKDANEGFDLGQEVLVRAQLLKLQSDRHVLMINMHHIISDGWSLSIFMRELSAFYSTLRSGAADPLPALALQYADYAAWQRSGERADLFAKQLDYWRTQLTDLPSSSLPNDRPRPPVETFSGAHHRVTFSMELTQGLNAFSHRQGVTLFMTLGAAFAVLLARYANQSDVVFGVPIANRTRPDIEDQIGFFVNTLVVRARIDGAPTFDAFLDQFKKTCLDAYANQDVPFEHVVSALNPTRSLSHNPLFQIMFQLLNNESDELGMEGLEVERLESEINFSQFDLSVDMKEHEGRLTGLFEYNTDLLDACTVERLGCNFENLLTDILANHDKPVPDLRIIGDAERTQLLAAFNKPADVHAERACVHRVFEVQARRTPEAVAVLFDDVTVTYADLDSRANRLAACLHDLGAGRGTLVGILLERSVDMLVAMLAVLKAGAAYVPMDPKYPVDRVRFMLGDTGARLVLTHEHLSERVAHDGVQTLCLDRDADRVSRHPEAPVDGKAGAGDLAYVIYTSGSTGLPKGVLVEHGSLSSYIEAVRADFGLCEADRIFQFASISFDVAVDEIYSALTAGARLVVRSDRTSLEPLELLRRFAEWGITKVELPTAYWHQFTTELAAGSTPMPASLRLVMIGGEAARPETVRTWMAHWAHGPTLVNAYGPTEATIGATFFTFPSDWRADGHVPIGRPLSNTQAYILDLHGRLAPIGALGELHLGGIQVARGYLNRPELTAEKFVHDPFGARPGARLYRTGDLARWLPDGNIEYAGRADSQVKIRGFRIELGEIESRLAQNPEVADVAVLVREDTPGDKRLVAYVVPNRDRFSEPKGDKDSDDQVALWKWLHEESYSNLASDSAAIFSGWDSSYDDSPIPVSEMLAWRDATVARILGLRPRRVLEIGVGTGILLREIAPHCEWYYGTDFSEEVIDFLRRELLGQAAYADRVQLHCRAADNLHDMPLASFDVIVMNSVIQYFPNPDYLIEVLNGAARFLSPGGAIFVGDVRNYKLHRHFRTAVEIGKIAPSATHSELKLKIDQSMLAEIELLVDPDFFLALAAGNPTWDGVDIQVRHEAPHNEMSRHRYDAVLQTAPQAVKSLKDADVLRWGHDVADLDALRRTLVERRFESVRIVDVPNSRLAGEIAAMRRFQSQDTIANLKACLRMEGLPAMAPQAIERFAREIGYRVLVTWASSSTDGALDLVFIDAAAGDSFVAVDTYLPATRPFRPLKAYTNVPSSRKNLGDRAQALHDYLSVFLPDFMLPTAFVLLDALPLNASGKVDRKALPSPEYQSHDNAYTAPSTPIEATLVELFREVLARERVSTTDNFFELGGHSLLATQLTSRIRRSLQIDLLVRDLFANPMVKQLAAHIERLKDADRGAGHVAIPLLERGGPLPASFAQERLWFIDQLETQGEDRLSKVYLMRDAYELAGPLDVACLRKAFQSIVDRHESLRTAIVDDRGQIVQVISAPSPLPFPVVDLSLLPEAEREAHLASELRRCAEFGFKLSDGALFQARLLKLAADRHVLITVMHHIVSDGWSISVLLRELVVLYTAYLEDRPSPLPALPVQYADFSHWQRRLLAGPVRARQVDYWRAQLAGIPTLLALPTDRPRPSVRTYQGATVDVEVSAPTLQRLLAIAKQSQGTLFMTLAAAFGVLLSRYSGQSDVCIGTPIANRNHPEIEPLIGFFVNTLVIRCQVDGAATFDELLRQVRATTLDAYAHQDVPFNTLVEVLQPARHPSHSPLFQVMLALQNTPADQLALPGVVMRSLDIECTTAKFDLTVNVVELGERLTASFEYNTDLFDRSTIERLGGHFVRLLGAVAAQPGCRIADLEMQESRELHRALVQWNDTASDYPKTATIAELFETCAAATPDALALKAGDTQLTYAELNRKANQLAHHLRDAGVDADTLVGICVERSADMIVGLLGILKAGGAYLPLDPAYPAQRLAYLVADAAPRMVLTQQRLCDVLPEGPAPFCLDAEWPSIADRPTGNPVGRCFADSLAYVTYTSGSTGLPKGVLVTQRNVVRLVRGADYFTVGRTDRFLQFSPLAFDASTFEIWAPLLNSACLVLAPAGRLALDELGELIEGQRIDTLFLTTALFNQLVELQLPSLSNVRRLLTGGEPMSPVHAEKFITAGSPLALSNIYGPTECTTFSTCRAPESNTSMAAPVPIGRPIANAQAYILDQSLNPVPIGVAGELHIAGDGLARGYLRRADLTAEKFIPNPFSGERGSRMYKTGDIARFLANGEIEFIGRRDDQVKIRGFRIELGEIEACLASLPDIRGATVVAREDGTGSKRLVAYLVAADDQAMLDVAQLRHALSRTLPDYMVPAHYVQLADLPLTVNGKIDRAALAAPDEARSEAAHAAPATPTEEAFAKIWADVLGLDKVSVQDNFFDLGGHSLLATRVVARIRQDFGLALPLSALFETPTIRALAGQMDALITAARTAAGAGGAPSQHGAIARADRSRPLPASFGQERLWFLDRVERHSAGQTSKAYLMPDAVRLEGELDAAALRWALQALVDRHETLRTALVEAGGQAVQVIAEHVELELPLVDLAGLPADARASALQRHVQDHAVTGFDLSRAPLMRTTLLRLHALEHVLLLNMHHSISDGWSVAVFINELSALYAAGRAGAPSPLAPLPIQYADYAVWQRSPEREQAQAEQLAYWKAQLAGLPTLLQLPTDRPRPLAQTFAGASVPLHVPAPLAQALGALSRQHGATLFMTLAAAFSTLLARHAGQSDIALGTPIANRTQPELEGLIGFFVNTLVLRADVDPEASFAQLLDRMKDTCVQAYAHQDMPFEQLVSALNPERSLAHNPLFQVMFVLQNNAAPAFELPGLRLSALPEHDDALGVAKFDLTLSLQEDADGLRGSFEYNTDLFDRSTIERLGGHLLQLLAAVAAEPARPLREVDLLAPAERRRLLVDFNDTATDFPRERLLHELFQEQAARTPEATALVFADRSLTYAQLDARANQLAHRLQAMGVTPDARVVLCAERGIELIVGMLAVLKAGGAYVPVDPATPTERIAFLVADAGAAVVVCQSALLARLPASAVPVLRLDEPQAWAGEPVTAPHTAAVGTSLAYVIYTSGSTGQPKGVMVEHRSVVRLIVGTTYVQLDASDCIAHCASPAFDAATWEIWAALLNGARLAVIPPSVVLEPVRFADALVRHGVSAMLMTTGLFNECVDALAPAFAGLRYLLVGGDVLDPAAIARLLAMSARPEHVINGYGPTETTTLAATHPIVAVEPRRSIPIGRPIGGTQIRLLDTHGQLVPLGVAGELHIGGDGVARGYLNQPELTRARFVPDPFSGVPGARLYKTGDIARWLADGTLEYLGRSDFQVKLRGFRIEPGEIEHALCRHPRVREAVVLVREDQPGHKYLAAYVVSADAEAPAQAGELREFLLANLPDYMVPAAFVTLPGLPLTLNGKVDRRTLPAPDDSALAARPFEAPGEGLESAIAAAWSELLGCRVGRHDNFFELGGHSLMAVSLVERLRVAGWTLDVRDLFMSPTVKCLAATLAARGAEAEAGADVPPNLIPAELAGALTLIQSGDEREPPLFAIAGAGADTVCFVSLARALTSRATVFGLPHHGLHADVTPHASVELAAAAHVRAICGLGVRRPVRLLGHSHGAWVALETARLLVAAGVAVDALMLLDAQPPAEGFDALTPAQACVALVGLLGKTGAAALADEADFASADPAAALHRVLVHAGSIATGVTVASVRRMLDVFHAQVNTAYRPDRAFQGPAVLVRARDNPAYLDDRMTTAQGAGWRRVAPALVERDCGGTHRSMLESAHAAELAAVIEAWWRPVA
jgi:amino acid adenylation domain-containing protein